MSDLAELYQAVILDHNNSPRNFRQMEEASHSATGHNPLCGDELTLYVDVQDGMVKDVAFQGQGCAISQASASLMTESIKGQSLAALEERFGKFHALVKGDSDDTDGLGKLAVFAGVREFPMRVKCATLGWHTLRGAISDSDSTISTE